MDRLLLSVRENPHTAAMLITLVAGGLVIGFLSFAMARTGMSLRPLVWFAGFMGVIAGPQLAIKLLDLYVEHAGGFAPTPTQPASDRAASRADEVHAASHGDSLSPIPWDAVFGPGADPALMTDAKASLAPILGAAEKATLSFSGNGESALAARFPSPSAAAQAVDAYGSFFSFGNVVGSDAEGWTAQRYQGQGEWVHVVAVGPELYAWTSLNRDRVLQQRIRALGALGTSSAATPQVAARASDRPDLGPVSRRLTSNLPLMMAILGLNVAAAAFWFFKGSAWATRLDGAPVAHAATSEDLRHSLLALQHADVPTRVVVLPEGAVEITWNYADARWFDLMRLHQLKRTERLVLLIDGADRTVRVREYWSAFDASAGPDGLRLKWQMNSGMQFFAFDHQRVFGAQLGADGKPTGALSNAYTFNLQALKAPVIEAVTSRGWRWQPVMWNAPKALRWATE